jgi:hypothetical protein
VAHAFHQLAQVRAWAGGVVVPGVAQVVEVHAGQVRLPDSGSQTRRVKLPCRSGVPSALVKTGLSSPS